MGRAVLPVRARRRAQGLQRVGRDGAGADVVDRQHPCATVYPDSGKVGIWTGNPDDDTLVFKSSAVTYFEGEPIA